MRPMTRDARLSALHRGGFRLPGPRFSPRYRPRLALRPAADRSQRAPRSQVVLAGGAPASRDSGYKPPPQDATPRSVFRMPPETPLDERDCESSSIDAICSQVLNTSRSYIPGLLLATARANPRSERELQTPLQQQSARTRSRHRATRNLRPAAARAGSAGL
jgi:hypothetical protein